MKMLWNITLAAGVCCVLSLGIGQAQAQQDDQQDDQKGKQLSKEEQKHVDADVQHFLNRFDRNQDKAIQKDELPARLRQDFDKLDRDSNGKLDRRELEQHALRMHNACDQCQETFIMIYRAEADPLTLKDLQSSYKLLRMLDQDEDGKITKQELKAGMKKIRAHHAQTIFHEWDANNDQKLTKKEVGRFLGERFDMLDKDGDGEISLEEMEQAFVPQKQAAGDRDRDRDTDQNRRPRRNTERDRNRQPQRQPGDRNRDQ